MKGNIVFGLSLPILLVLAVLGFFAWKRYGART